MEAKSQCRKVEGLQKSALLALQIFILLPMKAKGPGTAYAVADIKEVSHEKRRWDTKTNAMIVIEGRKGQSVAEICTAHQIRQSLYDQGRDQFLAHAAKAFAVHQHTRKEARLGQENARLKQLVGELTLELKTSDELLA
jgi:hypothetical protein